MSLPVARSAEVATKAGKLRADVLATKLPGRAWQELPAGRGAKGHRLYGWAVIGLADPEQGHRQLLIRCDRSTGELACCRCHSTSPVPGHPRRARSYCADIAGPGKSRVEVRPRGLFSLADPI